MSHHSNGKKHMKLFNDIESSGIRLATIEDIPQMTKVLSNSFADDQHMNWVLRDAKHNRKFEIVLDYQIRTAIKSGFALITLDGFGVSLWETEEKEPLSLEYLKRTFLFIFRLGFKTVLRALEEKDRSDQQHKEERFVYLSNIGVLPEAQGKGLASKLMNPVLSYFSNKNIPVFLETGNPRNVKIYEKKGFSVVDRIQEETFTIYYMKH